MTSAPDTPSPQDLMQRETRVRYAPVSVRLNDHDIAPGHMNLDASTFVFHMENGTRFRYEKGRGIAIQRAAGADPAEELLWLNGTVYAAVASLNGLYPVHASAVACNGRVYAFTGPSGAGKSTLISELGRRGLPMFCDDTLILDLSQPGRILCLPGHKRLKLWPDALAMTGAAGQEEVQNGLGKFFAAPAAGTVGTMLPLAELCFLEEGDLAPHEPARIEPVSGGQRIARLQDDHYTTDLFLAASGQNKAERLAMLVRLAQSMAISRFVRPRDTARFTVDVGIVEDHVRQQAKDQG